MFNPAKFAWLTQQILAHSNRKKKEIIDRSILEGESAPLNTAVVGLIYSNSKQLSNDSKSVSHFATTSEVNASPNAVFSFCSSISLT
jgi:hypothetical protein